MSCAHGNHVSGCDICSEIDAAYERGRLAALAAPMPEPVGQVLSEAQMGIRYDRRMGDVIWWNKPPGPAMLYAAPPAAPADSQPCATKPVVGQKAANLMDNADMVMVPREPTPDMARAGWALLPSGPKDAWDAGLVKGKAVYRAMIAAAPPAAPAPAVPLTEKDCTPNHFCNRRFVHLPRGEQCDRCGHE